jgi:hypothetical protein
VGCSSKLAARNQERKHDRADSQGQTILSSDAHLILPICQVKGPATKTSHSRQAPLPQTLDNLFRPLICPLYADAPSMNRTVPPLPQALQVVLRHIRNIYLSQGFLNKINHLAAEVTRSPL